MHPRLPVFVLGARELAKCKCAMEIMAVRERLLGRCGRDGQRRGVMKLPTDEQLGG